MGIVFQRSHVGCYIHDAKEYLSDALRLHRSTESAVRSSTDHAEPRQSLVDSPSIALELMWAI
jgi:hypothetical protein